MSPTWISVARLQGAGHGLRAFLAWWGGSLAAWLPAGWRAVLATSTDRLLVQQASADALLLRRQGQDGIRDLATVPVPVGRGDGLDPMGRLLEEAAASMPRWLLLPAANALRRQLMLPAAAQDRLHDVLGFEIERQTPFALADVAFDGRVLAVRDDGQLDVELVVVPRARFDAAIADTGALAAWLAGVDVADPAGHPLGVNLLPAAMRHRPARPWRWLNLALAVLAVLLCAFALARVLENRRMAADALQREVAKRAADARVVAGMRQRLVDAVEGGAYLQERRNARPSVVEVADELARRLPDGTYLEKLAIDGEQLTVIGLSNQAAALVGKLEGARQWRAPALTGALQQDLPTRSDRFTLIAQLNDASAPSPGGARAAR